MFQEKAPQDCPALAIDHAINSFRPETALECDHGLGAICDAVAISFEGQQESSIAPAGIYKIFGWSRNRKPDFRQAFPIEQFAGILLARRRNIAVANNVARRNSISPNNFGDQRNKCRHLFLGKWSIAPFMPWIDDFDPNARAIAIGNPTPIGEARMLRALLFTDHVDDLSVFLDDKMCRNLRRRVGQPFDGFWTALHTCIVQNEHRNWKRSLAEIW